MKIIELGYYHHLFVNYHVAVEDLTSFIPKSFELDLFEGRPVVSWVASTLQDVSVLGLPWKVNEQAFSLTLRTYIKQRRHSEILRGALTLKSWMSGNKIRRLHSLLGLGKQEPLALERAVHFEPFEKSSRGVFEYRWKGTEKNLDQTLRLRTLGLPQPPMAGYLEFFTVERNLRAHAFGGKLALHVEEKTPWVMWEVDEMVLPDKWPLENFKSVNRERPESAFVVKGSKVILRTF